MRIECAFNPDSLQCALKRIRCEKALSTDRDVLLPEYNVQVVEFYNEDLPHSLKLSTECRLWVRKRHQHGSKVPKHLVVN